MEEEILSKFPNATVEKAIGSGGNFIVEVNGEVVFSKKEQIPERFPQRGEILKLI